MDVRSCAGWLGTSGKVALVKRSHSDREYRHVRMLDMRGAALPPSHVHVIPQRRAMTAGRMQFRDPDLIYFFLSSCHVKG